jgi:N,N'-diacetyllegionaminate synthase
MQFNKYIKIGKAIISSKEPVFIIAEAGVNHNGDIKIAKKLIDVATEARVDAVKFQAFKTENLILPDVSKPEYQSRTTEKKESQFEMLKRLEISMDQNQELLDYCKQKGIIFLTTPFDESSLDGLDTLDMPAYKIASTDTTNLPFLKKIAKKGKPVILSTGMSYLAEVEMALREIYPYNKDVVLLQCTANYPINDDEANLNVINTFKNKFDVILGYSDHSTGIGAAPYAVPLGVKVIEKHFTFDKGEKGPDHKASLNPDELKEFVQKIRIVEKFLGSEIKVPTLSETKTRKSLQKCLVAAKNIKKGEIITEDNIVAKRTGGIGISPLYYSKIIGKPATLNYNKNDII